MSALMQRFEWSRDDATLQEFVDRFRRRLPKIISMVNNFSGDEMKFTTNDMFWVYDIHHEERALFATDSNQYASVPLSYPGNFHKYVRGRAKDAELSLREVLTESSGPRDRVVFVDQEPLPVYDVAGTSKTETFGPLALEDVYSQKYLLGYPFKDDAVSSVPMVIPLYIPVGVKVAVGLTDGNSEEFEMFCNGVIHSTLEFPKQVPMADECILVFQKVPEDMTDYDYLEPSNYLKMKGPGSPDLACGGPALPPRRRTQSTRNKPLPSPPVSPANPRTPRMAKLQWPESTMQRAASKRDMEQPQQGRTQEAEVPKQGRTQKVEVPKQGRTQQYELVKVGVAFIPTTDLQVIKSTMLNELRRKVPLNEDAFDQIFKGVVEEKVILESPTPLPGIAPLKPLAPVPGTPVRPPENYPRVAPLPPPPLREDRSPSPPPLPRPRCKKSPSLPTIGAMQRRNSKPLRKAKSQQSSPSTGTRGYHTCPERKSIATISPLPKDMGPPLSAASSTPNLLLASRGPRNWDTAAEIPLDVESFTVEEVGLCLKLLGMGQFMETMKTNGVDGELLQSMNQDLLQDEFGFTPFHAHKLMRFSRDGWRPKE